MFDFLLTFDLIIRQLTFLYNNFDYVFSNLLLEKKKGACMIRLKTYTVNEIIMRNEKAAITIAASITVFFYMSTGGYDLCYLETFTSS